MEKKLRVKMFGVFSASCGDAVLTFGRQRNSKFCQLFQLLMTRPGQGFSKKGIAEVFYGDEEVENANASLNNTIFRLRKYLRESPLPPGEYLILEGGVLRFNGEVEVESDVWSFECAVHEFEREQDRRKKAEICGRACELYRGEFLPRLSNEIWVIERGRAYREMYGRVLDYLLRDWKERGDWRSIGNLAGRAAGLCPGEGWESWQIESLAALGRYKEAEQVYQAAACAQEAGSFLSREQQEWFHRLGTLLQRPEGAAEEIDRYLAEQDAWEGAYGCTLPGFSDCFRMLKRVTAREGTVRFALLLCVILDANGRLAGSPEYCKKQGKKLRAVFRERLRKGDVYTQYSESQYLLLCVGTDRENALAIGARIDTDLRRRSGGRGGVLCRVLDGGGPRGGAA